MSGEHKLKEGDEIVQTIETTNNHELLFFSDQCSVYKSHADDFKDTKTSVMGDYIPAKLGFAEGEGARYMAVLSDYSGYMLFFYENGKVAKVEMSAYATKTNRRKLVGAYSDKSPLVAMFYVPEDSEFVLTATSGRRLLVHTGAIAPKATRSTIGVQVMTLKGKHTLKSVAPYVPGSLTKESRYRTKSLPAAGAMPQAEDFGEQLSLL
jgi:DNA gyrase subunit A